MLFFVNGLIYFNSLKKIYDESIVEAGVHLPLANSPYFPLLLRASGYLHQTGNKPLISFQGGEDFTPLWGPLSCSCGILQFNKHLIGPNYRTKDNLPCHSRAAIRT